MLSFNLNDAIFFPGPVLDSIVYDAAPHTCAPHQCSHDATIIEAYNVGKMYEYDYLVDSNTEMRSASPSKQSNLNMVARVKVQVLTPCEFSVKVIHLNPLKLVINMHTYQQYIEVESSKLNWVGPIWKMKRKLLKNWF